jgi:hypothetical protein
VRILIASTPATGHLNPLLAIGRIFGGDIAMDAIKPPRSSAIIAISSQWRRMS